MLRPFLIIGVGGSGGKTLRGIKYQLQLKLQQVGWEHGIPDAWQFLHFDTPIAQDGVDYPAPFLPHQEYMGLVSTGASYGTVYRSIEAAHAGTAAVHQDVQRQLPDPRLVKVDVTKGAGQYRAVGRAVALAATRDVAAAARQAIARLSDSAALGQLQTLGQRLRARDGGGDGAPTVIVVSSIGGGSGAGQFLDIIEIVKSTVKQHPWSNQIFSLLYAPDVFDQLNVTAGMPGNALAAIAETMNGFWAESPSESTLELLRSHGVAPSYGNAMDRVGAAYPFIVGRSNSKVTFEDQGAVYNAVATSLTAWITDERVQDDIVAYSSGNWQARVGANVLPDNSGLMSAVHHSPPFSSIGFGRVTLGREKFLEYSAERLARSAVDRMLSAHAEEDTLFARMTEREWIESKADGAYQGFVRALELHEETEENNQVIDKLRASENLQQIMAELERGVDQRLSNAGGLDKSGGLDLTSWSDRLMNEYVQRSPELLQRDQRARQILLDEWIERMPSHILDTVGHYIAEVGLPAVVSMLGHLERTVKSTADGLESEARHRDDWVASLRSLVADALRNAPNQQSIRPDQDVVRTAISRLADALEWASEARMRECAARLLAELREDFLAPLRRHLEGVLDALRQRVSDRRTPDNRDNEYEFWPRRADATVPRKYEPAPNERLLVAHTEYPREFEQLVRQSVEGADAKYMDAILVVLGDLITGTAPDQTREDDGASWSLIANPRSWRPSVAANPAVPVSKQATSFSMQSDPDVYLDRARRWMKREGTPFNAYISEDLISFFDEEATTPDVFSKRRDRYREQLQAALGASEPLVKLNSALLREVHGKAINEDTTLVFSSIPFREGTEMHAVTKGVLGQMGLWDDATSDSWFRDARVDGIEVFAMSGFPYQPIVMDSVMEPIARGWLAQSGTQDSREAFWKFKRARLLGESIPADPSVIMAILRGWYVAKALQRLKVEDGGGERGPRLSVWDAASRSYVDFPHPLLNGRNTPSHDFPGVVAQSLTIALALCNVQGTLAPLAAYRALATLGADTGSATNALAVWLQRGEVAKGAPLPSTERAGLAAGTLNERQQALRKYFTDELARFGETVIDQADQVSVYDYPVSWELRESIVNVLNGLTSSVMATRADDSGV